MARLFTGISSKSMRTEARERRKLDQTVWNGRARAAQRILAPSCILQDPFAHRILQDTTLTPLPLFWIPIMSDAYLRTAATGTQPAASRAI